MRTHGRQVVLVGQRDEALRINLQLRVFATDLSVDQRIKECVRKAGRVLELFAQRDGLFLATLCLLMLASQRERKGSYRVRAYAGIMAAKHMTHPTVALAVVTRDSLLTELQRSGHVATELGGRPETMKPFQKVVIVAGLPRQSH